MTVFIGTPLSNASGFPPLHPLGQTRQKAVRELSALMGWLDENDVIAPDAASLDTLTRLHQSDYIRALKQASDSGKVSLETRERYHFGTMENPIFEGLFERASKTVGGSLLAARYAAAGEVAFHPAGGTHHGRPDRASGFCYFNDPVFGVLGLLDNGLARVGYVDLDAHHGDGVQDAFDTDERVICASIHEDGRWPGTGRLDDRAGHGLARNAPVPRNINDSEFLRLVIEGVVPHLERMKVEALVITSGADALKGDPLSSMDVSNGALWRAITTLITQWPKAVVLGGGGYNPWTTTRGWAGLWAVLSGQDTTQPMPEAGRALLSDFESDLVDEDDVEPFWLDSVMDPPNEGPVRPEFDDILRAWSA